MAAVLLVAGMLACNDELDNLRPDLIVAEVSAPAQMDGGTATTVRVTVKNKGLRSAPESFTVRLESASPGDPGFTSPVPLDQWDLPGLAALAEATHDYDFTMASGPGGSWHLRATADTGDTVEEASETNNSTTISILCNDVGGPSFAPIVCSPLQARAGTTISITFTASEPLQADPTVTVGGLAATFVSASGLLYTYSYDVLGTETQGVVAVNVQGTDLAGNPGASSTTVTLDFMDPTLGAAAASPDPAKAGDTLAVTFTSSELLLADPAVTVDGNAATFVSEVALVYTYTYDVQGTETQGSVTIAVSATDPAGNPGSTSGSVVLDFTDPILSAFSVLPGLAKAGDTLTIEFTSTELLLADPAVTVDGNAATFVSETALVYTYTYVVQGTETEGTVAVDVSASDPAGNPASAAGSVDLDFTAPTFAAVSATPDPAKGGDTLDITFTASETLLANPVVTVAGIPATFFSESALLYTYNYDVTGSEIEGLVTIAVSASDQAGNPGSETGTVVFDFRIPSLSAAPSPAALAALEGDTVSVTKDITLSLSLGTNIDWEATWPGADTWLGLSPTTGTLSDGQSEPLVLSADPTGLAGHYVSKITFSSPSAVCEPFELTVCFSVRPSTAGSATLVYYTSVIDLSQQPYGLRLPDDFPTGGGPWPVVVNIHGYGGHANTSFNSSAQTTADANEWILVNLEGRGNHFYDGAAEKDLFEVLADVDAAYGVDWTKVFLEGNSMGGTGAFRHIARHPDVFAGAAGCDGWSDHRQWHRHYYGPAVPSEYEVHPSRWSNLEDASSLTHAENILPGRAWIAADGLDTAVWCENGAKLHERLNRLTTAHGYLFNPAAGHGASYIRPIIYPWLAGVPALDLDPDNVTIRANRLRTAKHAWLQVERFIWDGFAEVTAGRSGTAFNITARNVQRFTISSVPAAGSYSVTVNTVACGSYLDSSFPVTIELVIDSAGVVTGGAEHTPSGGLEKTPAREGPVMRAMSERFIVAYGSYGTALQTTWNLADAEEFCKAWTDDWTLPIDTPGSYGFNAVILPVDEATLTRSDIAGANLVIFGSEESSKYIAQMCSDALLPFLLPVAIFEDRIVLDGQTYTTSPHGIWMAYPNPLAPGRLVVVGHNVVGSGAKKGEIFWERESWPWGWPDYVVFDTSAPMRLQEDSADYAADQYVVAGSFDRDWSLVEATAPQTAVTIVAPSYGTSFPDTTLSITVTVDVTDEDAASVTGLDESAFDLRVDGEALTATSFNEVSSGRYEWSLDIDDLVQVTSADPDPTLTTYDLTVEVVRPGTGAPVTGIGRTRFTISE